MANEAYDHRDQYYVEIAIAVGGIVCKRTMSKREFTMLAFPRRVMIDEATKAISDTLALHDGKVE